MIISYCTDNYFRWVELFLKSFEKTNTFEKIYINACNLSSNQIDTLRNVTINNEILDFSDIRERLNISQSEFQSVRTKVAEGIRSTDSIVRNVMTYFAVDRRVENLYRTIIENPEEEYFWHFDVDIIFRGQIRTPVTDFAARFQDTDLDCRKIPIGILFLRNTSSIVKLIKDWHDIIRDTDIRDRNTVDPNKKLYGQYTFYQAYLKNKDNFDITELPVSYLDSNWSEESVIWSANKRLSYDFIPTGSAGNKTNTYRFFENEVNK